MNDKDNTRKDVKEFHDGEYLVVDMDGENTEDSLHYFQRRERVRVLVCACSCFTNAITPLDY